MPKKSHSTRNIKNSLQQNLQKSITLSEFSSAHTLCNFETEVASTYHDLVTFGSNSPYESCVADNTCDIYDKPRPFNATRDKCYPEKLPSIASNVNQTTSALDNTLGSFSLMAAIAVLFSCKSKKSRTTHSTHFDKNEELFSITIEPSNNPDLRMRPPRMGVL